MGQFKVVSGFVYTRNKVDLVVHSGWVWRRGGEILRARAFVFVYKQTLVGKQRAAHVIMRLSARQVEASRTSGLQNRESEKM